MSGLNLSDLTPVSMKVRRRGIDYDLRYVEGKKRFQFGNIKAAMDKYSFNIATAGGAVYIQCLADGKGQIYNTKHYEEDGVTKARGKTGEFGRPNLRILLDANGMKGALKFRLVSVDVEGAEFPVYQIEALVEGTTTASDEEEEGEVATSDGDSASEADAVDAVELEEEAEDVFADL